MVRNYVRKTNRQSWTISSMKEAIHKVKNQKFSLRKAAEIYQIPKATLFRRCKKQGELDNVAKKGLGRYRQVFTKDQEDELVDYLLLMERRLFRLTNVDLRKLCFQYAVRNSIKHPFNKATEMAGEDFIYGFLKRNKSLSLWTPEAMSAARAAGINKSVERSVHNFMGMDKDEESTTIIAEVAPESFLETQIEDDDDMDYYNDGSPEPKRKKENVDLFMDCEEEEFSNSNLQSWKQEADEFDNGEEYEQVRVDQEWENVEERTNVGTVTKAKREKTPRKTYDDDPDYFPEMESERYSAHSLKRKKPMTAKVTSSGQILSNSVQSIKVAPLFSQKSATSHVSDSKKIVASVKPTTVTPSNIILPQGTTLTTSSNTSSLPPGTIIKSGLPQTISTSNSQTPSIIGPDNTPLAVKTVLVNQITGQVYGEIVNPPNNLLNSSLILNNNTNIKTTAPATSQANNTTGKPSNSGTARNTVTNLMNYQSAEELARLVSVDENDPAVLCKFDPEWFDKKVIFESKMIILKEIMKKIQMPGKVLCKICSEVLNYSSGGVKSIEVHCNTIRHKNNLRNHYKAVEHNIAKQQLLANRNSSSPTPLQKFQTIKQSPHATKMEDLKFEEDEYYSSGEWQSGNLDALKLVTPKSIVGASFENLPPGVKTTIPFLQDYDKEHAKGLKHHLDVKLASSEIFSKQPQHLTEWMMDAGLLNESLSCPVCASATVLIPTVNVDNIDQNLWRCSKCSRTKSIRFLSFFDFHPIRLQHLLVLVYHWAFRSDTLKVFMTVQYSMPSSPRPLPILVNFWLSIRRLCSKMVNSEILTQQIGGYGKKLLIDSIVIPKGIIILATHDICSADVRFKVISPSDYKSYKETLQKWIREGTMIYTAKENIKRSLNTKDISFYPPSELPSTVSTSLTTFLNDDVSVLFGMEFFSSPIVNEPMDRARLFRQKTLFNVSLKNTMKETIELMQLALDEVMWRSHFGRTEAEAFVNILKAIAVHDKSKDEVTVLKRSQTSPTSTAAKKNPPVEVILDDDDPQIIASTSKTTHVEIMPRLTTSSTKGGGDDIIVLPSEKRRTTCAPAPIKELPTFPQVRLENYYYSSYTPQGAEDFSVVTLSSPQLKCHTCEKSCADNVHYMKHMLFHIDNYRTQNSDLGNLTQCKYCFRTFDTPYNMQCHMDEVHLSRDPDVKLCRICEIRFYETEKLILHMRVNHKENEMPYICEICMFRSSFYSDVMTHFNETHRATNKLLCPYCLRVFSIVSKIFYFKHLLRHQNRKSSGQRGRCRQCCLSFILDNDLKQHVARAHLEFTVSRNEKRLVKPKLSTSTMIPHPDKVPKSKILRMNQSIAQIKPRVKSRAHQNTNGVEIDQELCKFKCIECKRPMSQFHFSKFMWCSKCHYATYCLKSYSEHMIQQHSNKPNIRRTIIRVRYRTMYCVCQYASSDMIAMTTHLVRCKKKTCYPSKKHMGMGVFGQSATFPPLVVLDDDDDDDEPVQISAKTQPTEEAQPSASLATGLSLSTQLAANKNSRNDSAAKPEDGKKNDKHSKMLSVLGLMRKTSSDSKDSTPEEVESVAMDAGNCKILEADEALDRQEEEEVQCLMDIPDDVHMKDGSSDVEIINKSKEDEEMTNDESKEEDTLGEEKKETTKLVGKEISDESTDQNDDDSNKGKSDSKDLEVLEDNKAAPKEDKAFDEDNSAQKEPSDETEDEKVDLPENETADLPKSETEDETADLPKSETGGETADLTKGETKKDSPSGEKHTVNSFSKHDDKIESRLTSEQPVYGDRSSDDEMCDQAKLLDNIEAAVAKLHSDIQQNEERKKGAIAESDSGGDVELNASGSEEKLNDSPSQASL